MASGGRGRRPRGNEDPDVKLSKKLSWLLRHGAEKVGLQLDQGGYLSLNAILVLPEFQGFTAVDVKRVVENNDKQRFHLEERVGQLYIRANQGHTLDVAELELRPVTSAEEFPCIIHGTYFKNWEKIRIQGLSRMNRTHIHFAAGEPGESGVISGMRKSCQVIIYINLQKALDDGLRFFVSANNVILSPGDDDGLIKPHYFLLVYQRQPRMILPLG